MKKGLSRRNLFKYVGAGSATAVVAGCENKPEKLIPMLVPPTDYEYTPQTAYQYMTTCRECDAACGMMVTTREHRAQKAEGNPNHPLNQGALCAKGQASLQTLYNPSRHAYPLADGKKIPWQEGLQQFSALTQTAAGAIAYLGKPAVGSEGDFLDEWLQAAGGGKRVDFELLSQNSQVEANQIAFNRADVPEYAFEKAGLILNFSADFLETWGNPVENARRFADMHAYQKGNKNKFVHISPHVSLTGAKADRWVVINPGTEGLVALAIAAVIQQENGSHTFLKAYLESYSPENVAEETGVSAEAIRGLAKEALEHGPLLAIGGGNVSATKQSVETLVAVNILNAVSGALDKTLRFYNQTAVKKSTHQDLLELISDLDAGKIKLLIIDDSNPVYALPPSMGFAEAIKKTFVVSLASQKSETTHEANLVLPALTAYESWGDAFPRSGVKSIQQPVMSAVNTFDAKAREDILINTVQSIDKTAFSGNSNYLDFLQDKWSKIQRELGDTRSFENFWISILENGGIYEKPKFARTALSRKVTAVKVSSPELVGQEGLTLLPTTSLLLGDGSGANKPWLQEVPNPMSQIVWDSWVEINPDTAQKLGINDRAIIEVKTPHGSVQATAYYHFGIHRDAIAIPMGQGHQHSGEVADGFGINVMQLLPGEFDNAGNLSFVGVQAELKLINEKSYTVNTDGNARQLGREIAAATTVEELAHPENHGSAHKRPTEFYPDRSETAGYYKPYRWGMTIDLDRCNGCSACVVACYAENNIPVVGKIRTAIGREMSWIRMERYIEGYGDDFETRFSPMLCQQCGNAGCETVCPVYATYHNPEGLNAMIYNRCVGTRYCSNNCAYKVRRFNWFNYEFPAPLDQQLNSTITTREVGVMEKCTFCVQRIKTAKYDAKDLSRDLEDGEVLTACQQTCPTKAITFGNLMDPESKVAKSALRETADKRDRQYEVLAELNYKPAITYLKKVNTREVLGHNSENHDSHQNSENHG
ncbi:MAG: 4Fe-4S dicluster domain-containing protein [SAR324 cluster bacterium]|nr:4Fe-4S dicluster domain-containing protein [SAR324 cluster bacterium]